MAVALRPAGRTWPDRVASGKLAHAARIFRRELGLPDDGAIVMSGHQSLLWHAGILTKAYAAEALVDALRARGMPASAAWLVVDTDAQDPSSLLVPTLDSAGRRGVVHQALAPRPATIGPTGFAAAMQAQAGPFPAGLRPATGEIEACVSRIVHELARAQGQPSLAAQMTQALIRLLGEAWPEPHVIFSSALSRTTLFRLLVSRLQAEPRAAALAHNAAARATPEAELRELDLSDGRVELPLWRIDTHSGSAVRRRVYADEDLTSATLAPRALLLTMLLRSAGCECFIHGVGGERYDQAMERWLHAWKPWGESLHEGPMPLAPAMIATADLYPALEGLPPPTSVARREARQRARRARDNPRLVEDDEAAAAKDELLREIAALPRHDPGRRQAFLGLRSLVESHRLRHAQTLERLAQEAPSAAEESALDPAARRDVPCVFYACEVLGELRSRVRAEVLG
jgi:hypothetical protein